MNVISSLWAEAPYFLAFTAIVVKLLFRQQMGYRITLRKRNSDINSLPLPHK